MLAIVLLPCAANAPAPWRTPIEPGPSLIYQWANPTTDDPVELAVLLDEAREYLRTGTGGPAHVLAADFLAFVDPKSPGALTMTRFADLRDPAVLRLRHEVGLPVPSGYVFVRRYLTSAEMPRPIRARFDRHDNAAAMTVGCRFVAVAQRAEREGSWVWSSPGAVQKAVSHEMVHAYLNSLLGPDHSRDLPKWFHEGCATYFGGALGWEVSREYQRYLSVLHYIAAEKGKPALWRFVRAAVRTRSLSAALEAVGFKSEKDLLQAADSWNRGLRLKVYLSLTALVALGFTAAAAFVRGLRRRYALEEHLEGVEEPDEQ